MHYIGLDVASKSSFVYVIDGRGRKIESKEIPTDKDAFRQYFGTWAKKPVYVAVEAGGHTRWIHDIITQLGINVYVVNPLKVKLIAESKKKTDKIDAKILADLLRMDGLPKRVYVATGESRALRDLLRSRQQLIKSTTNVMNHVRGLLRQEGIRLKAKALSSGEIFSRLRESGGIPAHFVPILACYESAISELYKQRRALDVVIEGYRHEDIDLLKSIPGVGEVASKTIYAAVSTIKRFKRAKQLTSYCGLVPTVRSSGERADYGHITREGRSEVRQVAVQSAHAVLRCKTIESFPLRKWHAKVAKRRGFKTAIVGLARKLVEIAFYVLRDRRAFDARLLHAV
jgi:transposase